MFGKSKNKDLNENSPFNPNSPYAEAKLLNHKNVLELSQKIQLGNLLRNNV